MAKHQDYKETLRFLRLLEVPEGEALKALLGVFVPIQPGALSGTWKKRKGYDENVPTGAEIWKIFEEADFRCESCGSHYRITLDHKDKNSQNHDRKNLQVLCHTCNRATSSRPMKFRDSNVRIYLAAMELCDTTGNFPTNVEVREKAEVNQIGGNMFLLRFLKKRLAASKTA
jgi:hypothetical protein